jgi:hypothetical protein
LGEVLCQAQQDGGSRSNPRPLIGETPYHFIPSEIASLSCVPRDMGRLIFAKQLKIWIS